MQAVALFSIEEVAEEPRLPPAMADSPNDLLEDEIHYQQETSKHELDAAREPEEEEQEQQSHEEKDMEKEIEERRDDEEEEEEAKEDEVHEDEEEAKEEENTEIVHNEKEVIELVKEVLVPEPEEEVPLLPLPLALPVTVVGAAKKRRPPRRKRKKGSQSSSRAAIAGGGGLSCSLSLPAGIMKAVGSSLSGRLRFIVLNVTLLALLFFSLFTLLVF